MIALRDFNSAGEDREVLKDWLDALSLPMTYAYDLPECGRIAWDLDGMIAMGFLRKVEGNFAIMDSIIANPVSIGKRRSGGIDLVVEALIEKAKTWKIRGIFATTDESAILKRSVRHGFKTLPLEVIKLDLKEEN